MDRKKKIILVSVIMVGVLVMTILFIVLLNKNKTEEPKNSTDVEYTETEISSEKIIENKNEELNTEETEEYQDEGTCGSTTENEETEVSKSESPEYVDIEPGNGGASSISFDDPSQEYIIENEGWIQASVTKLRMKFPELRDKEVQKIEKWHITNTSNNFMYLYVDDNGYIINESKMVNGNISYTFFSRENEDVNYIKQFGKILISSEENEDLLKQINEGDVVYAGISLDFKRSTDPYTYYYLENLGNKEDNIDSETWLKTVLDTVSSIYYVDNNTIDDMDIYSGNGYKIISLNIIQGRVYSTNYIFMDKDNYVLYSVFEIDKDFSDLEDKVEKLNIDKESIFNNIRSYIENGTIENKLISDYLV